MRVLWLFPPSKIEGQVPLVGQNRWFKYMPNRANFIYPIVVAYGCTMLKNAGHEIAVMDCPAENKTLDDALDAVGNYDLVIMEGRTALMNWVWEIARVIKESNPCVKTALFGDHVVCRPMESVRKGIDYIIYCGDYDYGALMLVETLNHDGGNFPSIFTVPNMPDINHLPLLDRDLVNWKNYHESWRHSDKFGWLYSERGCHAKCTYCSWVGTFYHNQVRMMSPEKAVDEIQHAYDTYGIDEFLDDADTFYLKTWGVKFLEELESRNLDIFWNMQTRADQIPDVGTLKRMRKSGLHVVKIGADAGNDDSLLKICKGHTLRDVELAIKRLREAGLEVHINMIIGYPWQDKKTAYDTLKWVNSLKANQAQFSLIQPFIGTKLYDEAIKQKWFNIDPNDYDSWGMKKPILAGEMNADEVRRLYNDAWSGFYFRPSYILGNIGRSIKLSLKHRNLDTFHHLWRGYKGVKEGHLKAMD